MEKYIEANKKRQIKNINPIIVKSHKNLKNNSNKLLKSKKVEISKLAKKEEKIKNISNSTLTDFNKNKTRKRIINNLPVPQLYQKKQGIKINNDKIKLNFVKKKQSSCTQEKISKYTRPKYGLKNALKKNNLSKDISKCPDIDKDFDKDLGIDDEETLRVHVPRMTNKKKYNYFFEFQKTEIKSQNDKISRDNFRMKKIDLFEKTRNRLVLFPKQINEKRNNEKKSEDYNNKSTRSKTEKKREDKKENKRYNNIHNNNNNKKNNNLNKNNTNFINGVNYCLAFKKFREQKNMKSIKKDSKLFNCSNIFNSINSNTEEKKRKTGNRLCNNNDEKSKTIDNILLRSNSNEKKTHINKNINISVLDSQNIRDINEINTLFVNSNSDFISGKETNDSPENITDREEDKFTISIHTINHIYINERKRCLEKFNRLSKNTKKSENFLSPTQNLNNFNLNSNNFNVNNNNFNLNSTDENCYAHNIKKFIKENNSHSNDFNISSYTKKINRFQNLTSEKKIPLSFYLSPEQKNNLFKNVNVRSNKINEIKKQRFNLNFNKKIYLCDLLINVDNENIKTYIHSYLDKKSLIQLSSLNRKSYRSLRFFLFDYLKKEIFTKNNTKFIMKVIKSIFKYSSKKLKNMKELKDVYNNYKTKSKYDIDILKDLTRTFPNDKSFSKDSKNYQKLYNLLTCYSNYNKDIGYAQGLNFIGAISIINFESEEKSFLFLDSLINRFELDNFFGINNTNLITKLINYSNILNKYVPDIISYLDTQQISHGFFSTGWILTLFSNSMKGACLNISWAFMIIFGWKFFYSFVIQILKWYKDDIFNNNVKELCFKMKSILGEEKFRLNYQKIIEDTFTFMNKNIVL